MSAKEPTGHADGAGAIVLAGGKSARMGTPKALLRFDDTPLIEHIVGALRERFAEVIVVAAPDQALPPLPATLVRDEIAHQGPASGLYYGLRAARPAVSFVTSCDAAFLNLDVVSFLYGPMPTQPLGWFKKPITKPEDFKGLKFRTVGLSIASWPLYWLATGLLLAALVPLGACWTALTRRPAAAPVPRADLTAAA